MSKGKGKREGYGNEHESLRAFLRPFPRLSDVIVNRSYGLVSYAFGVPVFIEEASYGLKLFHIRFLSPIDLEKDTLYHIVYDRKHLTLLPVKEVFVLREFFLKSFV